MFRERSRKGGWAREIDDGHLQRGLEAVLLGFRAGAGACHPPSPSAARRVGSEKLLSFARALGSTRASGAREATSRSIQTEFLIRDALKL